MPSGLRFHPLSFGCRTLRARLFCVGRGDPLIPSWLHLGSLALGSQDLDGASVEITGFVNGEIPWFLRGSS